MDDRTPNRNIPQGSKSDSSASSGGTARPRRESFIASLLGRSLSLSDDHYLHGEEPSSENPNPVTRTRSRSLSVGDESTDDIDGIDVNSEKIKSRRGRSATLSLLGEHSVTAENNKVFMSPSSNNVVSNNESAASTEAYVSSREISQTDHLNKRLLSSFLTRINSMATNFMDPSGSGENTGRRPMSMEMKKKSEQI